jgi:hypothetical protein
MTFADIEPIIAQRCLGCHDGRGAQWPRLDYGHVAAWVIESRSAMLSCAMAPPASGLTMPVEEREALLRWIRCGRPR